MSMSIYSRKPAPTNAIQWDGTGESAAATIVWVQQRGGQASDHVKCCKYLLLHLPGGGSDYVFKGGWVIQEGAHFDVYSEKEFAAGFSKIEFQGEHGGEVVDVAGFDLSWCPDPMNRSLINELIGLEAVSTDNQIDGDSWMFKPYPISILGKLICAIRDDPERTMPSLSAEVHFLEVGCGVGAKLVMVNKIFGLDVYGIDYNEQYCRDATALLKSKDCHPATVYRLDVFERPEIYSGFDIVYLNRPFAHLEKQRELEELVLKRMVPRAYIILANHAIDKAELINRNWRFIAEDKVAVVFQKTH